MHKSPLYPAVIASCLGLLTLVMPACNGRPNPFDPVPGLTSEEIFTLTDGQVVGPVAVSSENLLAFSNGQNIFTIDLNNRDAEPIQVTDGPSAFAPVFLPNGDLVFGTLDPLAPNQIQLFAAAQGTQLGNPAPTTFGTITAGDLGLPNNTFLQQPSQFALNPSGTFGTGVIDQTPFLFDFTGNTVGVTPLNDVFSGVFAGPVSNPMLSPDLTQFAFTNGAGQIGITPFSNGVFETNATTFIGSGSFPTFTPNGQISFFNSTGLNIGNASNGFTAFGLGSPSITPGFPGFAPNGGSFFTSNSTGTSITQSSFPGSPVLPSGG